MAAGPYPTKAQFQDLQAQVEAGQADVTPRLRASGPDIVQALSGSTSVQGVRQLFLRPSGALGVQTTSAVRVQVPSGTTEVPEEIQVRVRYGNIPLTPIPLFGAASIVQEEGVTWLSLPVRVDTSGYLVVHLQFGAAYPLVITTDGNEAMRALLIEAYAGAESDGPVGFGGAWLVTSGPRTVMGRLSPDAFPFVNTPTPPNVFADPGLEVVLDGEVPYLRLRVGGQEYTLPFTPQT